MFTTARRRLIDWVLRTITWDQARRVGLIGEPTTSGVVVTAETALTSSPVFAAVRIISTAIGCLPLCVYRKLPDDDREKATDLDQYELLHDTPNPESVPSIWWPAFVAQMLLHGKGVAEIERDGAGRPLALWLLPADRTELRRANGIPYFVVHTDRGPEEVPFDDVFHVPYFSLDGVTGKGVIQYAREAVGLNKAMETGAGAYFRNLMAPGGVIEVPAGTSENARANIRKSIDAANAGVTKVNRLLMLEDGVKLNPYQVSNTDAQWIEGRVFGVQETARFFSISPTKLADLGRATWGNLESENASFIENTLRPILTPIEQEARKKLFTAAERKTLFVEAVMEARLRGLTGERYTSYSTGITAGFLLPSEARRLENLPQVPGIDERPRPGAAPPTPPPPPPPKGTDDGNPPPG
ncbi:MAG: phage portal protein, partial [Ardenticatenales bacterium]